MTTTWQSSAWINVDGDRDHIALGICGELDLGSRSAIEPAIVAAIKSCGAVTLDLAKVTFCDSQGLAMFVDAHELAESRGGTMRIRSAPAMTRRLCAITGDDRVISFVD